MDKDQNNYYNTQLSVRHMPGSIIMKYKEW
jgi:hypothetical protein